MIANERSSFSDYVGGSLPPRQSRPCSKDEGSRWKTQYELLTKCDWYHGRLSRAEAEKRVTDNGSFLVRESNSVGGFVVTARWNGRHFHVVIFPTSQQSKEKFHFEENYSFDLVTDLIKFYKDSQMPISSDSGAILFTPVNSLSLGSKENNTTRYRQRSRENSASRSKPINKSKARLKKFGSEPLLVADSGTNSSRRGSNASDGGGTTGNNSEKNESHHPASVIKANSLSNMFVNSADQKPPRRSSAGSQGVQVSKDVLQNRSCARKVGRTDGDSSGSDINWSQQGRYTFTAHPHEFSGPHKPLKPLPRHSGEVCANRPRPNVIIRNRDQYYDDDGNDYTDYAQVRAISSSIRPSQVTGGDYVTMEDARALPSSGKVESISSTLTSHCTSLQTFDRASVSLSMTTADQRILTSDIRNSFFDTYGALPSPDPLVDAQMWNIWVSGGPLHAVAPITKHLPTFTKPLDVTAWTTVLRLLADTHEDVLAGYITNEACRFLHRFPSTCKIPSVENGFHLLLIPKAERYREHVVSRSYTLSRFVAASILMCKSHERSHIVRKWIFVAESLAIIYRDFYSLHAVSDGLFCSQVKRVASPVTLLPQTSTLVSSIGREIRIMHQRGDECTVTSHVDICVPDVVRFIYVYGSSFDDLKLETPESLLEVSMAARGWAYRTVHETGANGETFELREASSTWVSKLQPIVDVPILVELFTTEVQMKLLWGARGYSLPANDRQQKLEIILEAFAKKAVSDLSS